MPGAKSMVSQKTDKTKKAASRKRREEEDYGFYASRNQALRKPQDQERLTEQELQQELHRKLTTEDPQRPRNVVIWDYNKRTFAPLEDSVPYEPMTTVFYLESELIVRDSEEDKQFQGELIDEFSDPEQDDKPPAPIIPQVRPKSSDSVKQSVAAAEKKSVAAKLVKKSAAPKSKDAEVGDGDDEDKEEGTGASDKPKKLLNQFNFCERGAQTKTIRNRDKESQTEPPPRGTYKDMCNMWIIYDAYAADTEHLPSQPKKFTGGGGKAEGSDDEGAGVSTPAAGEPPEEGSEAATREKAKELAKKRDEKEVRVVNREKVKTRQSSVVEGQAAVDLALQNAAEGLKYMERIINSNTYEDIIEDFRYFEDNADEYRETGEGTLLPLWKFNFERAKKMHATCISFSVTQPDMFVISYGSFTFTTPILIGIVVIYTLRNPSFPEHVWQSPKGAMACHVHPKRNCLICVGLYDGNVAVLNVEKNQNNQSRTEIYTNIPTAMKHHAPTWSVKWGEDNLDGDPTFYSVGVDGKVIHWKIGIQDVYGNGGLDGSEICTLYLPVPPLTGPDGTAYKLFGCGRCLAFHPTEKTTFLVGTAEGNIFQCCSLYSTRFEKLYSAHFLPVAAVQWNHYHMDVFISCSEDWTIKVWDRTSINPMYVFEIGVPILDVCWAPYSSTVFGAVTEEGKVLIYDLNVNKEKPICTQQVVAKKKVRPHRIHFNPVYPIILIADDRGQLTTLKLSPNLRVVPRDARNQLLEGEARSKFEVTKMSKLLSLVRDPDGVVNPKELPAITDLEHVGQPIIQTKC